MARTEVHRQIIDSLYPDPMVIQRVAEDVNYGLIGIMVALSTRDDLLAATFPPGGPPNPRPLLDAHIGLVDDDETANLIKSLAPLRNSFADLVVGFYERSPYEVRPCPSRARLEAVVTLTRRLGTITGA